MTDTTTADDLIKLLRDLQTRIGPRMPGADEPEDRAQWKEIDAACTYIAALDLVSMQIDPVDNATGETMCRVRFLIETPVGWVGAFHKEPLEYLLAANASTVEPATVPGFPPRILALLQEAACREPEGWGAWEDENGDPLQDDADAALAWIAARAKEGKA